MAVTPDESEAAQYQELVASCRHWENAIDTMLKKGGRTFHYVNPEFDTFLPILAVRYYHAGWNLMKGDVASDGETKRVVFVARQDLVKKDEHEQPSA